MDTTKEGKNLLMSFLHNKKILCKVFSWVTDTCADSPSAKSLFYTLVTSRCFLMTPRRLFQLLKQREGWWKAFSYSEHSKGFSLGESQRC